MKYWNSNLKKAEAYTPGEQPDKNEDFIKLNTNESPFPPSGDAVEAIKKACNSTLRLYPGPTSESLRRTFAEQNGLSVNNVFAANGSDEIFTLIFRGFIESGEKAAFAYPSYSLYSTMADVNGVDYETIELEDDFSFNLQMFLKDKYKLVIIANPNNPTGTYCSTDEISSFLDKFKGLLVVDEAYIDFYGGSSIAMVKEYDNLIVTRSFSKSYSLAGLRVGIAAAHRDIIEGFMKIKDSYNLDRLAIAGATAALIDEKTFRYNMTQIVNNKEYLEERLESLGFSIIPSRANFILVKHPDISAVELYRKLKENGILVRFFDRKRVSEYIRITIGSMMEIKTLCSAIETILQV